VSVATTAAQTTCIGHGGNTGTGQNDGDRDKDLITALHGGWNWVDKITGFPARSLTTSALRTATTWSAQATGSAFPLGLRRTRWHSPDPKVTGSGDTGDSGRRQNAVNRGLTSLMAMRFIVRRRIRIAGVGAPVPRSIIQLV